MGDTSTHLTRPSGDPIMSDFDLSDLIAEGKKTKRAETIKRAAQRTQEARDKTPIEGGPPIRRDIYQQLDWQPLSLTLIVTHIRCETCDCISTSPNPFLMLERYHKRHGRHYVEITKFSLLPQEQMLRLPRRIEERRETTPYCQHCFLQEKELCLTQTLQPQPTPQPHSFCGAPSVPQESAMSSFPQLWSDTFGPTWGHTNNSSEK